MVILMIVLMCMEITQTTSPSSTVKFINHLKKIKNTRETISIDEVKMCTLKLLIFQKIFKYGTTEQNILPYRYIKIANSIILVKSNVTEKLKSSIKEKSRNWRSISNNNNQQ
ncbi:hypothetical protein ACTFIU_009901 [Dictyostelium citrinum]